MIALLKAALPYSSLSFASSLSSLFENVEIYVDDKKYVPILIFCHY
ncbi:12992_t:CDS:2 [Racocetra persica]|uniref:12992_t:CDS:1 n=1 Tax=Racocetra persica TaxID=160502 RepID=A0ACA9K8B2_9GLOM|nr:12992_t:CDS:2 [Racocetra persica]